MEKELQRFLAYVRINTRANPKVEKRPSSTGQKILASFICQELKNVGLEGGKEIFFLEDGSLLVKLGSDNGFEGPAPVFSAHLDTYPYFPGKANPKIWNYSGGDIMLGNGVVIHGSELADCLGKRIVTSDGRSLLGGDNKAGVAAIVTVIERIVTEKIPHGLVYFWLCTDEELGRNGTEFIPKEMADSFDLFCSFDGNNAGEIDVGCFNGGEVSVVFEGSDAHAGLSGHKLKPAQYAASRFLTLLDELPCPWDTKGGESQYYAFCDGAWTPTLAKIKCRPRSFDFDELGKMALKIKEIAECAVAESVAKGRGVSVKIGDLNVLYVNTAKAISLKQELLEVLVKSVEGQGLVSKKQQINAGNNAAMFNLTYPEVAASNLGAGCRNFHGPDEHVVVEDFLTVVPTILDIIQELKP